MRRQGPSQGHPLSLPSAQSVEAAVQQPGDSQPPGQVFDPGLDLPLGSTPDLQGEADLVADHHRLEQGSLLGNKSDSTGPGFQTRDIPAIDDNPSRADRFQTTQGFQQCRLATAGTSHQDPVLTDLQRERNILQRKVADSHVELLDGNHRSHLSSRTVRPEAIFSALQTSLAHHRSPRQDTANVSTGLPRLPDGYISRRHYITITDRCEWSRSGMEADTRKVWPC